MERGTLKPVMSEIMTLTNDIDIVIDIENEPK
jgi:hypothetical protein